MAYIKWSKLKNVQIQNFNTRCKYQPREKLLSNGSPNHLVLAIHLGYMEAFRPESPTQSNTTNIFLE